MTLLKANALTKSETDFFETKIRPVLVESCYKCHSSTSLKVKGKLLLDTKSLTLKGGETGPAVVPGNLDKSLLIKAIRYSNKDLQMPPNAKLSEQIIKNFETWVKMGAPDPRLETPKYVRIKDPQDHWAYKPINPPKIPDINNKWISNPIDNFILSKLKENKLSPSSEVDRKVLIRRVFYDLIGLPPTEKEVSDFVSDTSLIAYEQLIDGLLNSPHYGERWARHWMDTSRYSDTTGTVNVGTDTRYTYSYTYRDYLINSFNKDKPFDLFVMEQIAADKMKGNKETLAALGFITLGKNSGNINDVIDDQIDVIFKGFMATTLVCARCHDHKFDPISTKDYYSMHGILNSSMVPDDKTKPLLYDAPQTEEYLDYVKKQGIIEKEIEKFIDVRFESAMSDYRTNTFKHIYGGYILNTMVDANKSDFIRTNKLNTAMIQKWALAINVKLAVPKRGSLRSNNKPKEDNLNHPSFLPFSRMFKVTDDKFKDEFATLILDYSEDINPFLLHRIKRSPINSMKDLAVAYQSAVLDSFSNTSTNVPGAIEFRDSIFKNSGPMDINRLNFQGFYGDGGKTMTYDNELREQRRRLNTLEITHVAAPPRAMVMVDKGSIVNSPVFIKGNAGTTGPIVPHRFLETFSYLNPSNFTNGSGRLELAQSIVNPLNPLTSRVMVNRIWQYHFGEGLVKTPDDFGFQTETPAQIDLLNYLAYYFMEEGWSVKKIHKLMLMSSTYKQSTMSDSKKAYIDPSNKFYWRMNMLKIDFETLRDTILYVGGKLDFTMGGQPVNLVTPDQMGYSTRRTIYGFIDRGNLPEVFTTFDFATPEMTTGRRFQTVVPKQSLFLMNNSMVIEQVRNMITRDEFVKITNEKEKIKSLYRICFQREPSSIETKIGMEYMEDAMNEDISDVKKEHNWKYGYRLYDGKSMSEFINFNSFNNDSYKSTNRIGEVIQNISISKLGGIIVNNPNLFSTRRWISSRDGDFNVNVNFKIKPASDQTSIKLIIYKNDKMIKSSTVTNYSDHIIKFDLKSLDVKDKIDFYLVNNSKSQREYNITIKINELKDEHSLTPISWNSILDFKAPPKKGDKELDCWERYAQILMLSNEMVFIN